MNRMSRLGMGGLCLLAGLLAGAVKAGDVAIVAAEFQHLGEQQWRVSVTLEHADEGWEHYADRWRLVDAEGNILGDRVLYHPHVDEQPFTRDLSPVRLAGNQGVFWVEAHDKQHGWSPQRLMVDLSKAVDGHLRVEGH